ncbi:hypothetical protein GF337_12780 [candidate division KSB1 bacterium]|nr:hypothetical protein [candidate division KSB1 bacterium]
MKKLFGITILAFCIFTNLPAQTVNVPLDHWIYPFIERMETKGIFHTLKTRSYPLTRTDVAFILAKIDSNQSRLTSAEVNLLEQFKGEFHEELSKFDVPHKPRYEERHVLTWREEQHFAKTDVAFAQVFDSKTGDQYSEAERTSRTTLGVILRGQFGGNLNFLVHAQNTLNRGTDITEENFDPRYGTPVTISGENVYSDDAWAYLIWDKSWFQFEFGRDQVKWGPGQRGSLMISAENPLFEMLKVKFSFNRFQFTSFHGTLHSGVGTKYLAGHRLELKLFDWLHIAGSEAVVYGNRDIELAYLNPIMPFHVAEHHLGDEDNNTMALDATLIPFKNHKFYFELFLDDFTTAENPFTYYGNKFAFLAGHHWVEPFDLANIDVKWEYTRIEPYVYTHYKDINIYRNYNQPIGHWLGPNADDLYLDIGYLISRDLQCSISAERIRQGEGDLTMHHEQSDGVRKEFLGGTVEEKWCFGFKFTDQLFRDVFLSFNYFHIRTDNLNLEPGRNSTDNYVSFDLYLNW